LRYGLISAHRTIRPIKAGEEIFSDYGYQHPLTRRRGYEWYYDEWQEFKANNPDHWKVKRHAAVI
jgi:SET domain-containing protein